MTHVDHPFEVAQGLWTRRGGGEAGLSAFRLIFCVCFGWYASKSACCVFVF